MNLLNISNFSRNVNTSLTVLLILLNVVKFCLSKTNNNYHINSRHKILKWTQK